MGKYSKCLVCAWLVAVAVLLAPRTGRAQEPIETSIVIDENESLLIGAIDITSFTLDNAERAFYLKGNVQFPPLESQRLQLESIRGFPEKLFFFVKLSPLAQTRRGSYTLSVEIGFRRFRNVVTFPVDMRRCGPAERGERPCGGGMTDLGSIVVLGSWPDGEESGRLDYTFERTKDPDVQTAFKRRFEMEWLPSEEDDGGAKRTLLTIRRR